MHSLSYPLIEQIKENFSINKFSLIYWWDMESACGILFDVKNNNLLHFEIADNEKSSSSESLYRFFLLNRQPWLYNSRFFVICELTELLEKVVSRYLFCFFSVVLNLVVFPLNWLPPKTSQLGGESDRCFSQWN